MMGKRSRRSSARVASRNARTTLPAFSFIWRRLMRERRIRRIMAISRRAAARAERKAPLLASRKLSADNARHRSQTWRSLGDEHRRGKTWWRRVSRKRQQRQARYRKHLPAMQQRQRHQSVRRGCAHSSPPLRVLAPQPPRKYSLA